MVLSQRNDGTLVGTRLASSGVYLSTSLLSFDSVIELSTLSVDHFLRPLEIRRPAVSVDGNDNVSIIIIWLYITSSLAG